MRSDMYENLIDAQNIHWKSTKLQTRDKRAFDIGEAFYRSKELNEVVRVILLRARVKNSMFEEYDICGRATNLYTHDMHPKMIANKTYGLIGSYAHSIMRMMAYIENPFKPLFAKNLRLRTVRLASEVVNHARQTTVRFMHSQYKEVIGWLNKIHNLKVEVSLQL